MSISAISSASLLDSSLATTSLTNTNQSTSTVNTASILHSSTSADSPDTLTQDMITLLKALAYGDASGARTDLVKFKADLKAQAAALTSATLAKDATSRFKDLASANVSAAKTESKADLQAQDASNTSSTQTLAPLNVLAAKISDSLNSGAVPSALHDLAGYLAQNGQVTGSLLNTSA